MSDANSPVIRWRVTSSAQDGRVVVTAFKGAVVDDVSRFLPMTRDREETCVSPPGYFERWRGITFVAKVEKAMRKWQGTCDRRNQAQEQAELAIRHADAAVLPAPELR